METLRARREALGMTQVETTMNRYQHVSVATQRSVMDALEERLFGSGG